MQPAFLILVVGTGLIGIAEAALPKANGYFNIYALPVGQGDCTVLQCPNVYGGGIAIIDAGSSNTAGWSKTDTANYLKGQTIEAVILTHADKDHINYLDAILAPIAASKYPTVYHSCPWTDYQTYVTDPNLTPTKNTYRLTKCCGWKGCNRAIDICKGYATLNIVGSEQESCTSSNGDSVVTVVRYGMTDALIVGDFEGGTKFISDFIKCTGGSGAKSDLRSELYRLAHHGADNGLANTAPFLQAIGTPYYVFSSSGLNDGYKHPQCSLKTYYTGKTKTVGSHAYTCYNPGPAVSRDIKATTTGIYVTTTLDSKNYIHNYIIQFAVGSTGKITPSMTPA